MPIYDFQAEDGEVIGVFREMAEAPEIGEPVEVGGKVYRRVYSVPMRTPESRGGSAAFPRFQSRQLPRRIPGNPKSDRVYGRFEKMGGTFNGQGQPQITSRRQADEIAKAMTGDGAVDISYGDL